MEARLGACSWSLRAGTPQDLAKKLKKLDLHAVQLALDPLRKGAWNLDATVDCLLEADIAVRSGMMAMRGEDYSTLESIRRTGGVRPDQHWKANLESAVHCAEIARGLNVDLVSLHAGFLPHDGRDPARAVMLDRLLAILDCFGEHGLRVAFETGQETAETLLGVLEELDHPQAGVNFDPANMILYGMGDPVEALRTLAPFVMQIHVKDARRSARPGEFGSEVPVGQGEVDWKSFFHAYRELELDCDLMIEREAGEDRVEDIGRAKRLVEGLLA